MAAWKRAHRECGEYGVDLGGRELERVEALLGLSPPLLVVDARHRHIAIRQIVVLARRGQHMREAHETQGEWRTSAGELRILYLSFSSAVVPWMIW